MAYSFEMLGNNFSTSFIRDTFEDFFKDGDDSFLLSFSNHDVKTPFQVG